MYAKGMGVKKNMSKSKSFLKKACKYGMNASCSGKLWGAGSPLIRKKYKREGFGRHK